MNKTYEDGVQAGRIAALEQMMSEHKGRMDNHSQRLRLLEKLMYAFFGMWVLIQAYPSLQAFVK